MDLRRHLWRVTSLYNIIDILKYSFAVSIVYCSWYALSGNSWEGLFKFIFIFTLLTFVLLNFPRILARMVYEQSRFLHQGKKLKLFLLVLEREESYF